ncbi:MAG TPA: gliding motility-associated C-terminal domain-containing protein, partial [Mucilaginibacter sp.]|nr:gliding motility-associated C-terminal domain-containing protein [Mucilaginibacter sp.]
TYPDCNILVYDRDGKLIYQSIGYAKPWDGTRNGAKVPQGTYYYMIDLKNGTPKISGWVLVTR